MNLDELTYGQDEKGVHMFLRDSGFETNFKKKNNGNGVDIVAIKDGYVFNIEVKKIVLNKTTKAYKLQDEKINGDILIGVTPSKRLIPIINKNTSMTKTIRFIEML